MKTKIIIFGVLGLALFVLRKVHMEKSTQRILYDYIMALHGDSKVDLPDHSFYSPEQKEQYAEVVMIGRCPSCKRFFLRKILQCPTCTYEGQPFALQAVSIQMFKEFVQSCEQFHQELVKASKIKTLSYSQIMKLYFLKEKSVDVR